MVGVHDHLSELQKPDQLKMALSCHLLVPAASPGTHRGKPQPSAATAAGCHASHALLPAHDRNPSAEMLPVWEHCPYHRAPVDLAHTVHGSAIKAIDHDYMAVLVCKSINSANQMHYVCCCVLAVQCTP